MPVCANKQHTNIRAHANPNAAWEQLFQEFSNIPPEQPPDPQATVYEGIAFIWKGMGYAPGVSWGSLRNMSSLGTPFLIMKYHLLTALKLNFWIPNMRSTKRYVLSNMKNPSTRKTNMEPKKQRFGRNKSLNGWQFCVKTFCHNSPGLKISGQLLLESVFPLLHTWREQKAVQLVTSCAQKRNDRIHVAGNTWG